MGMGNKKKKNVYILYEVLFIHLLDIMKRGKCRRGMCVKGSGITK